MSLINEAIQKLSGLKRADDFDDAVDSLNEKLSRSRKAGQSLRAELASVVIDSPDQVAGIRARIAENADEQDTLELMIEGANKKKAEVCVLESKQLAERKTKEAREHQKALHGYYIDLHRCNSKSAAVLEKIRTTVRSLTEAVEAARAADPQSPMIRDPYSLLTEIAGGHHIGLTSFLWSAPSPIPDYFPAHPEGPILARMNEVKL